MLRTCKSDNEVCFGAEITCAGVRFQTEAEFNSLLKTTICCNCQFPKLHGFRNCFPSFPIKFIADGSAGRSGLLSYQYHCNLVFAKESRSNLATKT